MVKKQIKPPHRQVKPRFKREGAATSKRSIHDVGRDEPTQEDVKVLTDQMVALLKDEKKSSPFEDRATAISTVALLEYLLEQVLLSRMKRKDESALSPLFRENGALGSLFAKIHLAYALGIIDTEMKDDLESLRKIRNAFAHARINVSFENSEISTACRKLHALHHFGSTTLNKLGLETVSKMSSRHMFLTACTGILFRLTVGMTTGAVQELAYLRDGTLRLIERAKAEGKMDLVAKLHGVSEGFTEAGKALSTRVDSTLETFAANIEAASKQSS